VKALICLILSLFAAGNAWAEERIIALSPHACEMLYAIGAGPELVGSADYCDFPAEANKLPRVGSHERINVEAALRLKPDAAVVLNRNVGGVAQLEAMGVRIVTSNPVDFTTMFSDILKLGELSGHRQSAAALVGKLKSRLQQVRSLPRRDTAVFYEVWHDPMLTAAGPGFISQLIHEAGGRNVFEAIDIESPHVNVESVIRARPEVIVIPLENRNIEARKAFWEQWLGHGKVRFIAINPDLLHRPGPRLLDGLELLQQALQNKSISPQGTQRAAEERQTP